MCSETFLRLPEEKRQRFLDAAWEEFTRVSFSEASINQIVRRCGIARGSFYQYFRDKEELMEYLMREGWSYLMRGYHSILRETGGDLFALQRTGDKRYGHEIVPAGVMYVPARDVLISARAEMSSEEIIAEKLKSRRRRDAQQDNGRPCRGCGRGPGRCAPAPGAG